MRKKYIGFILGIGMVGAVMFLLCTRPYLHEAVVGKGSMFNSIYECSRHSYARLYNAVASLDVIPHMEPLNGAFRMEPSDVSEVACEKSDTGVPNKEGNRKKGKYALPNVFIPRISVDITRGNVTLEDGSVITPADMYHTVKDAFDEFYDQYLYEDMTPVINEFMHNGNYVVDE